MAKLKKHSWLIAFVSALGAVALHSYLTYKYFGLRFGGHESSSMCNLSGTWNCDAVSASSYAQFLSVPMALWGAMFNLVFALMLLLTRYGWYDNDARGKRYVFWLAAVIGLASVVMGIISSTGVGAYCLFCVIAYVLSAVTLVATYLWAQPQILKNLGSDLQALFTTHKGTLGTFIAIPALAFLLKSMFIDNYGMSRLDIIATEYLSQWQASKSHQFGSDSGIAYYKGRGTPKMEIVEFADFTCPHCRSASTSLDSFVKAHSDVKITYKYFPLDGTCNPGLRVGPGVTCEAAYATHCAEQLFQKGWDVHHHLFEKQDRLFNFHKADDVRQMLCKDLNLDCDSLGKCIDDPKTKEVIQTSAAEGKNADVRGTPSIFVNGKQLPGGQLIPILEQAYRSSSQR